MDTSLLQSCTAPSAKMISRFVSTEYCWVLKFSPHHPVRLLLLLLLLSVILLVVTSGERDLARDTDGDGLRWTENISREKIFQQQNIESRDYVNDPDDDNDGILDIHDDDDDGDGSTPGCIFISRVIWIISRYSWCSRRGLAWRLVTPSMIIFIIL